MPRCPICRTQVDLIRYEGLPVHNCGTCGGYWITPARFSAILRKREVTMPDAVQARMIALADASNSTEKLWCWTCGREMVKEAFKHWSDIQLDRCTKCGGIWLDRGELEKCQIYWEYMQDHPDSDVSRQAEQQAMLDSRWAVRKARLRDKVDRLRNAAHDRGTASFLAELFSLDKGLDPGA